MNLSAALAWVEPIENLMRIGSRSVDTFFARITEAESLARKDWLKEAQRGPTAPLSDIMHACDRTWRYAVSSAFSAKTQQGENWEKKLEKDSKRALESFHVQQQARFDAQLASENKGGGKRRKGNKSNGQIGGGSSS